MRPVKSFLCLVCGGLMLAAANGFGLAHAEDVPMSDRPPEGSAPADNPPPAKPAPPTVAEATPDVVFQSESWRQTMRTWNEWLSIQKRYDREQVKRLKEQLAVKVKSLSYHELVDFQEDLHAKLEILMGEEAREARLWLAETLSTASKSYGEKLRADFPDVANMSAAEVRESLAEFEVRRARRKETSAAYQAAQRERIKAVQAQLRQQHDDAQRTMDRDALSLALAQQSYFVPAYRGGHRFSYADRPVFPLPLFIGIGFW